MPAAPSLLLILIAGLGCWPFALMPNLANGLAKNPGARTWARLGLILAAGLLADNGLVVLFGRIQIAGAVGLALGAISLAAAVFQLRGRRFSALRVDRKHVAIFLGALALLAWAVLLAPLSAWDARSIWFFHAKIIFHGGLTPQAGWDVDWSHPDYPKLLPILAAQVAGLVGFWNEQLPKAALLFLAAPLLATSLSLARGRLSLLALGVLIWWPAASGLTNGYADSYLALYGALGILLIGSGALRADLLDLVSGVVFLAVCSCLKNEGALFDICAVVGLAAGLASAALNRPRHISRLWLTLRSHPLRLTLILLIVGLCCVVWPLTRSSWGLHNDMKLGPGSLILASRRLSSARAIALILRDTLWDNGLAAAAACGLAAVVASRRAGGPAAIGLFCLCVAALYQGGLTLIYLSTPNNLAWHLATSANRTSLLSTLLCLAPIFLYVRDVGGDARLAAPGREQFLKS